MITDIPSHDDFRQSGVAFLNLAWTTVIDLYLHTAEASSAMAEEPELTDNFWAAAQRPLANAAALVQQGIEFLIKARIVEVSPFLLFDGGARDWPRGCATSDTPFSEFRTIDAQDLPKVHDTVYGTRLPEDFVQRVAELRRIRNSIMHTVAKSLRIQPARALVDILEAHHTLIGPGKWIASRRDYIDETPETIAYTDDFNEGRLIQECKLLPTLLSRGEIARYLGMCKPQRWYGCPQCRSAGGDLELEPFTAQLRPNEPLSTEIYCFVCDQMLTVVRRQCNLKDCPGNVIDDENDQCLSCFGYQATEASEMAAQATAGADAAASLDPSDGAPGG
jgi:hypothetical protein